MQTIIDKLVRHAGDTPHKPFLVFWEGDRYQVITYREFLNLSRSLALFLERQNGEGDGPVFIVLQHHPLLHAMFVACMLCGRTPAYLPFPTPKQDPEAYFASHKALFERTLPAVIVTYDDLVQPIREIAPDSTRILNVRDYVHAGYADVGETSADAIALLQHSSGTTGLKKGVELTYGQIGSQVASYADVAGLGRDSVVVSWLPLYHDMGLLTSFLIPLSLGASVVAISPFEWVRNPTLLLRAIEMFNGTHTWLPNFAFNHIMNATPPDASFKLHSMRAFISCSEPAKASTLKAFASRFQDSGSGAEKIQACYAMAETVFAVSQYSLNTPNRLVSLDVKAFGRGQVVFTAPDFEPRIDLVSNGLPIPGIEIGILRDNGEIACQSSHVIGEIVVRGDFVFDGYYRNEDATVEAFVDGWYRTGDLGFLDSGELFICGRTKDVIIVHGRNYYSHDIEEIVSTVEGVIPGRAVAIGVDDAATGSEELLLMVETQWPESDATNRKLLRREIKRTVFERLEVTPREVEFVPAGSLVKTTSGKFSRVENLKRYRAMLDGSEKAGGLK